MFVAFGAEVGGEDSLKLCVSVVRMFGNVGFHYIEDELSLGCSWVPIEGKPGIVVAEIALAIICGVGCRCCIRIVILFGALGWASQVISSYFECVEKIVIATILGIARYIFFTIPAVYILGGMMGVQGVWVAQPVADVITFVLVAIFVVYEIKRLSSLEQKEA